MKALITGISGFTGQYMAKELKSFGWEVWGIGTKNANSPQYYQVNLLDESRLKEIIKLISPDAVVHLAGTSYVAHSNAIHFYENNVLGTYKLLSALSTLNKPPSSILLASSAAVYGNQSLDSIAEDTPPAPINDYGVSKLSMELMARLWLEKLPIVITRPFNYTGVGQSEAFLLPKIVGHYRRKLTSIELGNLNVSRDFSDVRMVVSAYRKLLNPEFSGKTVNICSGKSYSLTHIIKKIESISGISLTIKTVEHLQRKNELNKLCGNPRLLKSLIGDTEKLTLEDTLLWMIQEA